MPTPRKLSHQVSKYILSDCGLGHFCLGVIASLWSTSSL